MPGQYIPIFVFAILVAAIPAIAFGLARRAGRDSAASLEAANAAGEPLSLEETERRSNNSQIFLAGALFLLCEAVMVFVFLWAARMSELGLFGLAAIAGFAAVLACGYIWLYKHRALGRL
ncbi:MAG: NADH-quinone oxidoreductase subunit A [Acidobacteriota bacterium]|nr:NADH-quinone oxidoreductase subunit A [Acidobacteriota bacterium]